MMILSPLTGRPNSFHSLLQHTYKTKNIYLKKNAVSTQPPNTFNDQTLFSLQLKQPT
jgi:hypothetical protein